VREDNLGEFEQGDEESVPLIGRTQTVKLLATNNPKHFFHQGWTQDNSNPVGDPQIKQSARSTLGIDQAGYHHIRVQNGPHPH
jgi:hypothetical protein